MALLKTTIVVAFACLVNAFPQENKFSEEGGWKKTATIKSMTTVYDPRFNPMGVINVTVETYNLTRESFSVMSSAVRRNLANLPLYSEDQEDSLTMDEWEDSRMPLAFNMSVTDMVATGPRPIKATGFEMHVNVYSNKHHLIDIMLALRNFLL